MQRRQPTRLYVFCDGGSYPSGTGHRLAAGCAAVARAESGAIQEWAWRALPPLTNNEAEYAGLILGMELAQRLRARSVVLLLDSEVVVGQMEGRYAVNSAPLVKLHRDAQILRRKLHDVRMLHIPREWNCVADALARQARLNWDDLLRFVAEPPVGK